MTECVGVLLAAGAGRRLGLGPKALLQFGETTLVEHAATELLLGGCTRVVVVCGAGAERVAALSLFEQKTDSVTLIVNAAWESGMASSFRLGVRTALTGEGASNVVLALVDQPSMTAAVVNQLLAAHKTGRITAAAYLDADGALRRGHPVVFAAEHAAAAAKLATDDAGAREFLRTPQPLVDLLDCSELGSGADIDSAADLHLLGTAPASRNAK